MFLLFRQSICDKTVDIYLANISYNIGYIATFTLTILTKDGIMDIQAEATKTKQQPEPLHSIPCERALPEGRKAMYRDNRYVTARLPVSLFRYTAKRAVISLFKRRSNTANIVRNARLRGSS